MLVENKRMPEECHICFTNRKKRVTLECNHSLCKYCYDRISDTCPFCRHPIKEKKNQVKEAKPIQVQLDPEDFLEYDENEWITYSRVLRNGDEIIQTFRSSSVPNTWRNDDMSTIIKRRRTRKNRSRNNYYY